MTASFTSITTNIVNTNYCHYNTVLNEVTICYSLCYASTQYAYTHTSLPATLYFSNEAFKCIWSWEALLIVSKPTWSA